jgi:uncharacterized protein
MNNKIFFGKKQLVIIGLMVFSLISFTGSIVWAKSEMPKVLYFGTQDVGTSLYAISITISEKISPELGIKSRLIPGTDVDRINMMRQGKIQIAMLPADCYWSSMGLANYATFALGPQPVRIVWAGTPDYAASSGIATAISGIKTPYDLKGKRVAVVIGSAWSSEGIRAALAFGKLTEKDVTWVQVSSSGSSIKALNDGKADFTYHTNTSPGWYEAENSPYGVYLLRYPAEDKEGWKRYNKIMPYHRPGIATKGVGVKEGEKVPVVRYSYPIVAAFANQPDDFIYEITKAMHHKIKEIAGAYVGNEAMLPERGIIPEATTMAPYHPGAIKYFKEAKLWTAAHEEAQQKRIAQLDKVNKRWTTYTEDAQDRITAGKKVNMEKEWRDILDNEVGLLP